MGTHINADGEFQSDKYPTCPAGKVPLSVKDPAAQPWLWLYAQGHMAIDEEFSRDLCRALLNAGYVPGPTRKRLSANIGFEKFLMPGEKKFAYAAPQNLFRPEYLFIEGRAGVFLLEAKVGTQHQIDQGPISTLFYSCPTNKKTLERIRPLIAEANGLAQDNPIMQFAWDETEDPDTVMGLPIDWDIAEVGNQISFLFHNRSSEPVRVTGVLRGSISR